MSWRLSSGRTGLDPFQIPSQLPLSGMHSQTLHQCNLDGGRQLSNVNPSFGSRVRRPEISLLLSFDLRP